MNLNVPITSPQYTKLRSNSYAGQQNLSLFSNRVVLQGQVTSDFTQTTSWITFSYTNITGSYLDVEPDMTILFGTENDVTKAFSRGRIHPDHPATFVTVTTNESDLKISPAYYFWVIDQFEVFDRLSRPVGSNPIVQYIDYDEAYHTPEPSITGLQYVYVGECDAGTGKLRVTLAMTGIAIASGATISSWAIILRSGTATLISGSLSSPNAVIDFEPGETWFMVQVMDSNGVTGLRHSGVKAHDANNPPDLAFENIEVSGAIERGWTARCPSFDGVDNVLPFTLGVAWRTNEFYGGVAGLLGATNNIDFIGYLRKDDPNAKADKLYTLLSTTTFEMVDVATRLASTECQQLALFDDATAVTDHILTLTPRRSIHHLLSLHCTLSRLVDIAYDSFLTSDVYEFPIITTPGDNLLSVCNGIGQQVNAMLEFGPDGRVYVPRDARYLTATERNALPTIANLTIADNFTVAGSRNYENNIGVLDANGAVSMGGGNVLASQTRSPGTAQGISQGRETLANQITATGTLADSRNELSQRGGNHYEIKNFQETLTIEFPDGYNFFIPSKAQWYTITISSADFPYLAGVMRFDYDSTIRWLVTGVNFTHENKRGTRKLRVMFQRESRIGDLGLTIAIPSQPTASILPFSFVPPAFPNFDPMLLPPVGIDTPPPVPVPSPATTNAPKDGNFAVTWTAAQCWFTNNYIARASPTWIEGTPDDLGSFNIKQVIMDLFTAGTSTPGAYLLASDGNNSAVWHTTDASQNPPVWSKGASVVGIFTVIRLTQTPGGIEIYAPATVIAGWTLTVDWSVGSPGVAYVTVSDQGGSAGYHAGSGYGGLGIFSVLDKPHLTGDVTTFTSSIEVFGKLVNPSGSGSFFIQFSPSSIDVGPTSGTYSQLFTYIDGPFNGTFSIPDTAVTFSGPDYPGNQYEVYLKKIIITGTGTTPSIAT